MTLVDTSAWVEYLQGSGSATSLALRGLIEEGAPLHTTDVIAMELLAGARDERHVARLRRLLAHCRFVPTEGLRDFEQAATLHRQCRRAGETTRALACLISVVAIRGGLPVLHSDPDLEAIARHSELRTVGDGARRAPKKDKKKKQKGEPVPG